MLIIYRDKYHNHICANFRSREQELEAEYTLVEHQLRELVDRPDLDKSTEEQQEQEYLMDRLLDIVNQRSNIVDSMDEDRIRSVFFIFMHTRAFMFGPSCHRCRATLKSF